MLKIHLLLLAAIILSLTTCVSQKLEPRIATDKKDPRLEALIGTWYHVPTNGDRDIRTYSKLPQDSSALIYHFHKNGSYTLENKVNPTDPKLSATADKKWLWILKDDRLYLEASRVEKGRSVVYLIHSLTASEMILERKGLKNIYQPFLCYDGFLYTITESPASFGDSPNAFENYISEHLVVTEGDSATANLYLSFTINCHGEVAEVITDSYNLSELEKSIVELIKHMPNWTAGTQRGKAVNFKKQYKFVYDKGELIIYKGR